MVGVAGRSKGCVTCRKRKKGCDARRPACNQCTERNIICGGYDLDRVFIYSKYEYSPPPAEVRAPPKSSQDSTMDLVAVTASTYRTIPLSLARSAFTIKGMEAVLNMFPAHKGTDGAIQVVDRFSSILAALSMQEEALRQTILAVGLATLGKGSNDEALVRQGQALYGKALQELGLALQNPARRSSEALLATTGLMGLYEILYPADEQNLTQARNWMSHAQGELALIIGRGPEAYTTNVAHLLFSLARYNTAFIGVRSRKPTVFSEERWKTIPWRGRVKPPSDTIVDILLEIPEILRELDHINSLSLGDDRSDEIRRKVTAKCWAIHLDLDEWFKVNSHEVYKPDVEKPISIEFASLGIASLSLRYWTTATLLYQSLDRALRFSPNEELAPYINRPNSRCFARLIARSAKWLFQKDNGVTGATSVSFPLGIALVYFRQSEVPDPEYMNMVFCAWNDPDWPRSIKGFLKSMSNSIQLPTSKMPKDHSTWSTSELNPILDRDGNILGAPFIK